MPSQISELSKSETIFKRNVHIKVRFGKYLCVDSSRRVTTSTHSSSGYIFCLSNFTPFYDAIKKCSRFLITFSIYLKKKTQAQTHFRPLLLHIHIRVRVTVCQLTHL